MEWDMLQHIQHHILWKINRYREKGKLENNCDLFLLDFYLFFALDLPSATFTQEEDEDEEQHLKFQFKCDDERSGAQGVYFQEYNSILCISDSGLRAQLKDMALCYLGGARLVFLENRKHQQLRWFKQLFLTYLLRFLSNCYFRGSF